MRKKNSITKLAALFLGIILLSSCSIKLKGAKHGINNTIETYLVENNTIQYFVKPLIFKSEKSKIALDFTLRGKKDKEYKARVNFTLINSTGIDSLKLMNTTGSVEILTIREFNKMKEGNNTRYFSEVDNITLYDYLTNNTKFSLVIFNNGKTDKYLPSNKTLKKLKRLPEHILSE